jgi:hypothetical protein
MLAKLAVFIGTVTEKACDFAVFVKGYVYRIIIRPGNGCLIPAVVLLVQRLHKTACKVFFSSPQYGRVNLSIKMQDIHF